MTNATQRKIVRWIHILGSIPILGYIYGPVAEKPEAAFAVRFFILPFVAATGFWMWKGVLVRKWFKNAVLKKTNEATVDKNEI